LFVAAAVLANNLMIIGELLTKRPRRRRDANRQFEVGQHAQWNGRGGGAVAGFGSAGQRHRQVLEDLDVVALDVGQTDHDLEAAVGFEQRSLR
jgi:hypothetical protein